MSKRFIDTDIWTREWFMAATPPQKCAFMYLLHNCDAVGVWKPNFKLAEYQIGAPIDWGELHATANGNIEILSNGKWWVKDFVSFQYGELKETCRPHLSYIQLLKKHGLLERVSKGYVYPTGKGKGKGKGTGQRHQHGENKHVLLTDAHYSEFCGRYGKPLADEYIQKVDDYCENHGKTYSNWVNAVHTYIRNDEKRGKLKLAPPKKLAFCPQPKCSGEMVGGVCMACGWSKSRPGKIE